MKISVGEATNVAVEPFMSPFSSWPKSRGAESSCWSLVWPVSLEDFPWSCLGAGFNLRTAPNAAAPVPTAAPIKLVYTFDTRSLTEGPSLFLDDELLLIDCESFVVTGASFLVKDTFLIEDSDSLFGETIISVEGEVISGVDAVSLDEDFEPLFEGTIISVEGEGEGFSGECWVPLLGKIAPFVDAMTLWNACGTPLDGFGGFGSDFCCRLLLCSQPAKTIPTRTTPNPALSTTTPVW